MTETTIRPLLFKQDSADAPILLLAPWPEVTTIMPGMIDGKLVSRGVIAPNDVVFIKPDNGFAAYTIESEADDIITLTLRDGSQYTAVAEPTRVAGETPAPTPPATPAAPADPAEPLRTDGPTLAEYVDAGYAAETYPPKGYAAREEAPATERAPDPEPTRTVDANGKIIV